MPPWVSAVIDITVALLLVVVNGFFVAAEFSLVKVRGSQVDELVELMFDAIINAEHIDPTMEEGIVAIGKLLRLIVDDEGVSVPRH